MREGAHEKVESSTTDAQSALIAIVARCLRCGDDLSRLPEAARYCPRCGLDAHASPPASVVAHVADGSRGLSDLLGGWEHLYQLFRSTGAHDLCPPETSFQTTSLMVKGYSAALYRLGRRYEIGGGAGINPREALRCYTKSARLGNVWALARLAGHQFARYAQARTPTDAAPGPSEPDLISECERAAPLAVGVAASAPHD